MLKTYDGRRIKIHTLPRQWLPIGCDLLPPWDRHRQWFLEPLCLAHSREFKEFGKLCYRRQFKELGFTIASGWLCVVLACFCWLQPFISFSLPFSLCCACLLLLVASLCCCLLLLVATFHFIFVVLCLLASVGFMCFAISLSFIHTCLSPIYFFRFSAFQFFLL